MKSFDDEFEKYSKMMVGDTNFCFTRYADGEVLLMKGMPVGAGTQAYHQDRWSSPPKITLLGADLLNTLNHTEKNYFYAITSPNQSAWDYEFLRSRIYQPDENLTFSDLWINSNYLKFKLFIKNLQIKFNLVCNKNILQAKNVELNIKSIFPVEDDCVNFYEKNKDEFIKSVKSYCSNSYNELFLVSAGPLSEIIIHEMFQHNPNNKYIDVGSSLDEFIHSRITRPYMITGSKYNMEKVLWN